MNYNFSKGFLSIDLSADQLPLRKSFKKIGLFCLVFNSQESSPLAYHETSVNVSTNINHNKINIHRITYYKNVNNHSRC